MSWFSDHVYDAGHIAGDTKDLSADIIGSVTSKVTFGYWDFEWEDLEGNIFNSSLGQGLYAFGNFMNRDFPNFIKYPADSLSANEEGDGTFNRWRQQWRQQWGDWKGKMDEATGDFASIADAVESTPEEAASIKGPGKMRGRDPEMAFNEGVKGYGRSSLKIGKGGGGGSSRKGGKFDAFKSGRYSMPS